MATGGLGAGRTAIRAQGTPVPELRLGSEDVDVVIINKANGLFPVLTGTYSLGKSGREWTEVWATSGTISSSDRRLKEHITSLEYGLETVMDLDPVSFAWRADPEGGRRLGLIAQDVVQLIPEVVHGGDSADEMLGLNYAELIPVLIRAIQEQQAQHAEALGERDRKTRALEDRVGELERLVMSLADGSER